MKKIIAFVITMIMLLSNLCIVTANDSLDSIKISSDVKKQLTSTDNDTVVKLYSGMFMKGFSDKTPIDKLIEEKTISEKYMVISSLDSIEYKRYNGEKYVTLNAYTGVSDWSEFYKYVIDLKKVFGSSTKVNNIYCLDGESSHDGVYIYYSTSKGDYVLYKEYLSSDNEYLFELNDFYDFASVVSEERIKYKDYDGGVPSVEELYVLDDYKFEPYVDTSYVVAFGLSIIFILICFVFVIKTIIKKNKKSI